MSNSAAPTLPVPSNSFDVFAEGAASSVPITTMKGYHPSLTHNSYNLFDASVVEGNNSSASNSAATPTLHRSIPNKPELFNNAMKKMMKNIPVAVSGNNSSASNSAAAAAASAPNQYMDMTPRDHFIIEKLGQLMNPKNGISVPFPPGLLKLIISLAQRRLNKEANLNKEAKITIEERAGLEKYLLTLMKAAPSSGGNNSAAASAAPVYVPMTEEDIIYLRVLKNFIGIESGLPEDRRVPLSSELIELEETLRKRTDKTITVEERKALKEGLDAHVKEVKATRGSSGGKRRKSRKSRKSQSGRKTKSRKSHRRR